MKMVEASWPLPLSCSQCTGAEMVQMEFQQQDSSVPGRCHQLGEALPDGLLGASLLPLSKGKSAEKSGTLPPSLGLAQGAFTE
jgi:hypothetical protein